MCKLLSFKNKVKYKLPGLIKLSWESFTFVNVDRADDKLLKILWFYKNELILYHIASLKRVLDISWLSFCNEA